MSKINTGRSRPAASRANCEGTRHAHGHDSELHIGVAHEDGAFAAHAWVEQDGRVLIGEAERRTYTRLVSWPIDGVSPGIGADRVHPR